jgi:hypothetical protein
VQHDLFAQGGWTLAAPAGQQDDSQSARPVTDPEAPATSDDRDEGSGYPHDIKSVAKGALEPAASEFGQDATPEEQTGHRHDADESTAKTDPTDRKPPPLAPVEPDTDRAAPVETGAGAPVEDDSVDEPGWQQLDQPEMEPRDDEKQQQAPPRLPDAEPATAEPQPVLGPPQTEADKDDEDEDEEDDLPGDEAEDVADGEPLPEEMLRVDRLRALPNRSFGSDPRALELRARIAALRQRLRRPPGLSR